MLQIILDSIYCGTKNKNRIIRINIFEAVIA